ncbi:hypothetical protein, partial [Rhizobium laguerreae]|uniref:hypothetical protein n=1 Tax=Rhizobium laguerreae TaxID=1076926 RepID=UPI001981192A
MISFTGAMISAAWLMPEKAIRLAITTAIVFMVECPASAVEADTSQIPVLGNGGKNALSNPLQLCVPGSQCYSAPHHITHP